MKKIVSTILVCVLLMGSLLTLASCGIIFGKYEAENLGTTLEFSGKNVTITTETEVLGTKISKTYEAEYTIDENEEGEKTITFIYSADAEQHPLYNGSKAFSQGEEDGVKYIKIGIIKFNKTT